MDLIVRNFEPGERDISLGELQRLRSALLGRRGSTYKRQPSRYPADKLCVVAVYLDDDWDLSPPEREEAVLGEGASFAEAFANARGAIAKRHVFHKRRDGAVGWFDLKTLNIVPEGA